ncbi:MAG TPA: hypothetical protein VIG76_01425 [Amnibacterium sp.]|uniref:hypothetical protein n=1 Tax=Amnibacterium sp. TaxID=1872496 RepID=UPI002F92F82B
MSIRIAAGGATEKAARRVIARLVDERAASAITVQDPTLWGPAAEAGATNALGWTEAVADGRSLVHPVESLRTELGRAGATRVALLAGPVTGLAATTITATQGVALRLLDPHADTIGVALGAAADTVVVLADASGSGLAAEALLQAAEQAVRSAGVDAERRIVVVAEPGSALESAATAARLRVFPAPTAVGDRFSALSAAALVPAGLAGADLAELLDEAESEELNLAIDDPSNNGLRLAALLAALGQDGLAVVADGTHVVGYDRWAAHLLGAAGIRARAIPADSAEPAELPVLRIVSDAHDGRPGPREVLISGSLGELLLVLQYTAALLAHLHGVDPFGGPAAPTSTPSEGPR